MRDDQLCWLYIIHFQQITHRFFKRLVCLQIIEITDVLTCQNLAADDESNRILEIGSHGKNRLVRRERSHDAGRTAARTSNHERLAVANCDNGVLDTTSDGALANEEGVGDTG